MIQIARVSGRVLNKFTQPDKGTFLVNYSPAKSIKKLLLLLGLITCFNGWSQSWVPVDLNTTKNFLDVHFLDPENGWIVGSEGAIFRYYDKSWHELDAGTGITFNAVFMADTNDVWIAGEGGKIINYTPAGFQVYDSPTTKSLNDIYMVNNSKGWIVGANGTALF